MGYTSTAILRNYNYKRCERSLQIYTYFAVIYTV